MAISVIITNEVPIVTGSCVDLKLTCQITPDDCTIQWQEGGYKNSSISGMVFYDVLDGNTKDITVTTNHNKWYRVKATNEAGEIVFSDPVFVRVIVREKVCDIHQCNGTPGIWCKTCDAQCYVKMGFLKEDQEEEPYQEEGFENLDSFPGVKYPTSYGTDVDIPPQGKVNVKNIITKAQNVLKKHIEASFKDPHLNPVADDTDELENLFQNYGLDIHNPDDQEQFQKLQAFERKNFLTRANSEWLATILKPMADVMCCLENELNTHKPIVWARVPNYLIKKHTLVNLYSQIDTNTGKDEIWFRPAHAWEDEHENGEFGIMECHGVLLRDPMYYGELVPIMTHGTIREYDYQGMMGMDAGYPGQKLFLGENGIPHLIVPEVYESYGVPVECIYQEIGVMTELGFSFSLHQPIRRVGVLYSIPE